MHFEWVNDDTEYLYQVLLGNKKDETVFHVIRKEFF